MSIAVDRHGVGYDVCDACGDLEPVAVMTAGLCQTCQTVVLADDLERSKR